MTATRILVNGLGHSYIHHSVDAERTYSSPVTTQKWLKPAESIRSSVGKGSVCHRLNQARRLVKHQVSF